MTTRFTAGVAAEFGMVDAKKSIPAESTIPTIMKSLWGDQRDN